MKSNIISLLLSFFLLQMGNLLSAQTTTINWGTPITNTFTGGYLLVGNTGSSYLAFDKNSIQSNAFLGTGALTINRLRSYTIFEQPLNIGTDIIQTGTAFRTAAVNIVQSSSTKALALEDGSTIDTWSFNVNEANHLAFYFKGVLKGAFSSIDGTLFSSDRRLKTNIKPIKRGALKKVMRLEPSTYTYNHARNNHQKSYGYIAQKVHKILPDIAQKPVTNADYYTIKYQSIGVVAVKAIQELKEELDSKDAAIVNLEERIAALTKKIQESIN